VLEVEDGVADQLHHAFVLPGCEELPGELVLFPDEVLIDADRVVVGLDDLNWVGGGVQPEESLRLVLVFFWERCLVKEEPREAGMLCLIF
jgi:hypothetical protein